MTQPSSDHELHRRAAVVDCHNDLPAQLLMWNRSLGEQGEPDYFRSRWLRDAERGGVDLQVMPVWTPSSLGEGTLRQTLVMLAALTSAIEANRDRVTLCTTAADIDGALKDGRLGALLALEGATAIGSDLELLETLHRLGVRMISFTHWHRTVFAEGSGDDRAGGGLTDLGRTALADIEQLGMIFDVSHLGRRSVDDVLSAATRPVLASHSMVNGSDLRQGLVGLESTGDLPHVTDALLDRGWSADDVRKLLGENALRLFRQLLVG